MYKIVNLETFWVPEEEKYNLLKQEIGDSKHVLGLMLADGFIHNNPGTLIEQLSKELDLVIVPGLAGTNTSYSKTIPFNFNLHTTYNSYKEKDTYKWNSSSNKFLFLGGVPDRLNRIGLLNKFRKVGLLDHAVWTFFKPWTEVQEDWCRSYTCDYDELLKLCRSIDTIYDTSKHYGTSPSANEWTKNTGWIDPTIFHNTVLSIVSEGVQQDDISSKYLTEKTYRVFVQRHPFLHASNPEMFDYIKELGFKTFEDYMLIKDYAYLPDEDDRLNAIVENTKYFLENFKMYEDNIRQDTDYNYKLFFQLAKENINILNKIQDTYNIDQTEIDKWFNQKGFGHLVRAYG
jgi:hypothetical protein